MKSNSQIAYEDVFSLGGIFSNYALKNKTPTEISKIEKSAIEEGWTENFK